MVWEKLQYSDLLNLIVWCNGTTVHDEIEEHRGVDAVLTINST